MQNREFVALIKVDLSLKKSAACVNRLTVFSGDVLRSECEWEKPFGPLDRQKELRHRPHPPDLPANVWKV